MLNLKFWTWADRHRYKVYTNQSLLMKNAAAYIADELNHVEFSVAHHVTHAPRPPAPRPARLSVIYTSTDGREYREYVPLNGQKSTTVNMPNFVEASIREGRGRFTVRYEFGYEDGSIF